MKTVILDAFTSNPGDLSWDKFKDFGELTVYDYTPEDLVIERCRDAEAVIINKVVLDKDKLNALPKLKYIGMLSTGYNVVDIDTASKNSVIVSNVPTYSTRAVAQNTFAHILEIYNCVALHNEAVHHGEWSGCRDFSFMKAPILELSDKTIGIIGYGKIGSEVAKIANAFGMHILCYVPHKKPQPNFEDFHFTNLDTLAEKSDIVTLHCPLTKETTNIIDETFISKMKKNAIIINTSRGPSINEKALADALKSGRIKAAGVDVLSTEPPKEDNPLLSCDNCFITPHISWAGFETRERLLEIVYDNLKSFVNGNPKNVVNN